MVRMYDGSIFRDEGQACWHVLLEPYAHACQALPGEPCKDCIYQVGAYRILDGQPLAIFARFRHRVNVIRFCRVNSLRYHKQREGLYLVLVSEEQIRCLAVLTTEPAKLFARCYIRLNRDARPELAEFLRRSLEQAERLANVNIPD